MESVDIEKTPGNLEKAANHQQTSTQLEKPINTEQISSSTQKTDVPPNSLESAVDHEEFSASMPENAEGRNIDDSNSSTANCDSNAFADIQTCPVSTIDETPYVIYEKPKNSNIGGTAEHQSITGTFL